MMLTADVSAGVFIFYSLNLALVALVRLPLVCVPLVRREAIVKRIRF